MSKNMTVGGVHLELGDNDWLMVRNTASADKTGETLAALRVLSERSYLMPVPKPAVAVWKPDDDARLWRNMRQLGIGDEEASAIADTHDTTDLPNHDHDMWALLLDMSERLRRIQEITNAPMTVNLEEPGGDDGELPAWNIKSKMKINSIRILSHSLPSLVAAASAGTRTLRSASTRPAKCRQRIADYYREISNDRSQRRSPRRPAHVRDHSEVLRMQDR